MTEIYKLMVVINKTGSPHSYISDLSRFNLSCLGSPHSDIGDLSRFWLSCLSPLILLLTNYLAFQSLDFKRT